MEMPFSAWLGLIAAENADSVALGLIGLREIFLAIIFLFHDPLQRSPA